MNWENGRNQNILFGYLEPDYRSKFYLHFFIKLNGIKNEHDELHCTFLYSDYIKNSNDLLDYSKDLTFTVKEFDLFDMQSNGKKCLVAKLDCKGAHELFHHAIDLGATYDFPEYTPHITLSYDCDMTTEQVKKLKFPFEEEFKFGKIVVEQSTRD